MLGLGWAGLHLCDVGLKKHSDQAASKASFRSTEGPPSPSDQTQHQIHRTTSFPHEHA